ncbi:hypothetical protein HanXRQr2_Chr15g0698991 [Helianthus annuus]|uniref:Uncharacterized protein n=1 Tax=Helianthus annuus TaxID=4232 RepID=A0A9K3E1C6_HELAN|nr:hypothetical protein HanXRQr2_Chr15g0698991 [Helianthus annuus]KAJ0831749.1 hypothetical protein HanPSC8_Chr15g0670701 [Helianthus annuus]
MNLALLIKPVTTRNLNIFIVMSIISPKWVLIDYVNKTGKITSFVLYLYTTFQTVSFLTNVDRQCPLLGILLQV